MSTAARVAGIVAAFLLALVGWQILGHATQSRGDEQRAKLSQDVAQLWGRPQAQAAPSIRFHWKTTRPVTRTEKVGGVDTLITETVTDEHVDDVTPDATAMTADIHLDQRRKGLVWYSLYGVHFDGRWTYHHARAESGTLDLQLTFPDAESMYDGFRFVVNGNDLAGKVQPSDGTVGATVAVAPGDEVTLEVAYTTRGLDDWRYVPGSGVASLRHFKLRVTTDFADIDYPAGGMSPSTRERSGGGWILGWDFEQSLSGNTMGVVMPQRIQPGELAARLAFSAPISLALFFLLLFVLSMLRGLEIHPVNYLALAGAFFSFHLLFAYLVDHVTVVTGFVIASVASIGLVVSYLRLVVSTRFAFVEAGLAQLVYQVGFSLAHFWDGYTGLTVSVLAVLTLFLLMQLTGRVRWSETLGARADAAG